jgi:hypothetical protein
MSVLRWVISDPYDGSSYHFPRNPTAMTSLYPDINLTGSATTAGTMLLWQGATALKEWTFTGPILDAQQLADLNLWVLQKNRRLNLTDHFGRVINLVFTKLDAIPKRRLNYYWSHDYTVTAQVITVGAPSVGPVGPV